MIRPFLGYDRVFQLADFWIRTPDNIQAEGLLPRGDFFFRNELIDIVDQRCGLHGIDLRGLHLNNKVEPGGRSPVTIEADLPSNPLVAAEGNVKTQEFADAVNEILQSSAVLFPSVP